MRHFMKIRTLIFFLLIFIQTNSQVKTYEFSFCGRSQKINFYEEKNGKITGYIESTFFKNKSKRTIIKTKKIPEETIKSIISEINNFGIYSLKDSDGKVDCGDYYLDADYFSIKITDGKNIFRKTYAEVYPESETKFIEKNDCRRNAQIIATIVDKELNLKSVFNEQFKRLGYGTCYWTGIFQVCLSKKKS